MQAVTWNIGSNPEYDALFEQLREQHHNDRTHRLWKNYSEQSLKNSGAVARTICFNDQGDPEMCSTISSRSCWPQGAYRILNRLWKHSNKIAFPKKMSPSFGYSAISQIDWLQNNTEYKLYFISRQTDNWQEWVTRNFYNEYGVQFVYNSNKYLTCPGEQDDACWQNIIYNGSEEVLQQWKQKLPS